MSNHILALSKLLILTSLLVVQAFNVLGQEFIHPGIHQTEADLKYMKEQVWQEQEPWSSAFDQLKAKTDLHYEVKPFSYVLRGPYGRPNIGGNELRESAELAYDCALLWYITEDKAYANKAIEIMNEWSAVLWHFDYNDAKLLAGWTGHLLCNAAEVLRYTESGWKEKDVEGFTEMLLTVYYPLMREYFPRANGNWDGAIIHSLMAIAVFTDNRELFNDALDHFLHAPLNGSLFKYIYPSGQCQESTRDQAHVQLGLGEFAGAARTAFTQGVDLFSIGNYRIALGYEYTAKFLVDSKPHCYGTISERAKELRDIYEYVYWHYKSIGMELPYTKIAADSIRPAAERGVLTAFRASGDLPGTTILPPRSSEIAYPAGAMDEPQTKVPSNAIWVSPGQSLQATLDSAARQSSWVVAEAGVHVLPSTLVIPSNVTLSGEGLKTILIVDPETSTRDAIKNAEPGIHDVTICDLVIEGALTVKQKRDPNASRSFKNQYNRGGILFLGKDKEPMRNIKLRNITVRNCTYTGVFISGGNKIEVVDCNFSENGSAVVPGPKLLHNLSLAHCSEVLVADSRLVTSPFGCGVALTKCESVDITDCEVARNGWYGLLISESQQVKIRGNLIEANDSSGIMIEHLFKGAENIEINSNKIQFNNGFGIESHTARNLSSENNSYVWNGSRAEQEMIK